MTPTKPFLQYRLCNADFGLVTFDEELAQKAQQLADLAHQRGIRLGCVLVDPQADPAPLDAVGYLLHPLLAVAAVGGDSAVSFVVKAVDLVSRDGASGWCGRDPRIIPLAVAELAGPHALHHLLRQLLTAPSVAAGIDYREAAVNARAA